MGNDNKSGLRIKAILLILIMQITISTSTQLLISDKENENTIQTTQEIQIATSNNQTTKVTSRSGNRRENSVNVTEELVENDEENNYISIEEIEISKNMDLTNRCGISKEDFKKLMENLEQDSTGFFYDYSDIIYDLCEKYELNEIFFCGLIAAESGWNISSNHRAKCNYISMMSKGKLIKYNTPEEGLEAAAKLLHTKYLSSDGAYYSGKTLANVQKIFCPNSSTWVNSVYGCMKQIVD